MHLINFRTILPVVLALTLLVSCQDDPPSPPPAPKPKVGTTWTYNFYTYYPSGGLATTGIKTHKAVSEVTLGGEQWLMIKDVAADTLVYYLKEKTGGLYQYTNNSSYIFLKSPATLNETYSTYHRDSSENFTVKSVNTQLATGIGDIIINYYEGYRGVNLIDEIWYNANAWIVRHQVYKKLPLSPYFKYSALFIQTITY